MSAPEGIVLQRSKIERRRKSRKSCFLADTATAILRSADTKLRGRFCVKRCGPLISPHAKRISGSKNFRSSPQIDFVNTIEGKADLGAALLAVRDRSRAAVANSMDTPRFRPIDLPRYRTYYPGLERALNDRGAARTPPCTHSRIRCRGYSRLMGADEVGTLTALKAHTARDR